VTRPRPSPASDVIAADTGQAIILLDLRAGRTRALPGTARTRWLSRHPGAVPVPVRPAAPSWGTSETAAALPALATPSAAWAVRALAAVAVTLTARSAGDRRRSFARMVRLVRAASFRRHAAGLPEAEAALRAVRWTAQFVPARMACLEESVAAMVALSLAGRRADWRHGIASDPVRMHAWIEAGGQPVAEPASTSAYTLLIRIPPPGPGTGGTA
jgi:Transglutaminase-like superfamily